MTEIHNPKIGKHYLVYHNTCYVKMIALVSYIDKPIANHFDFDGSHRLYWEIKLNKGTTNNDEAYVTTNYEGIPHTIVSFWHREDYGIKSNVFELTDDEFAEQVLLYNI